MKSPAGWVGSETIAFTAKDSDGFLAIDQATFTLSPTELDKVAAIRFLTGTTLEGKYPNPFNPSTTIRYGITTSLHI